MASNSFCVKLVALWDTTTGSGGVPQLKGAKAFSFEELSKCTNNFSETNTIGTGGYGMVSMFDTHVCMCVYTYINIKKKKRLTMGLFV